MGMYHELNSIKRAVDQEVIEMKRSQEHQKQVEYIKNELKSMLESELMAFDNIYNDEIKATAVENVVNNTLILLYNKDFTRQFLNEKYYTIARQVEQIKKKTSEEISRQQQLKNDILEIKKQQEAEKLKKLQQQNAQSQKVQQAKKQNEGLQMLGKVLIALCLPIGILILAILNAASKQK